MSEFTDILGHPDVCDSFSGEEALNRAMAGSRGRSSKTVADAMTSAVGYFTVHIELGSESEYLTYGDGTWDLIVGKRSYKIHPPMSNLPVKFEERAEDIVAFKALGWGVEVVDKITYRKEDPCPACRGFWKRMGFPRKTFYCNIADEDATDDQVNSYYSLGILLSTFSASDDTLVEAVCTFPLCSRYKTPARYPLISKGDKPEFRVHYVIGVWPHKGRRISPEKWLWPGELTQVAGALLYSGYKEARWPISEYRVTDRLDSLCLYWTQEDGLVFPKKP